MSVWPLAKFSSTADAGDTVPSLFIFERSFESEES